jgi:hypothetical protein
MSGPVETVFILAAVGYVLARRVIGEPAQAKRMLILPIVLNLIGLSDVSGQVKTRNDRRVMWTRGQDGAPHRMSPFLDNLRRSMTDRDDNHGYRASGCDTRPGLLSDYCR